MLNFLPKLNWKFVRDEMRSPEGTQLLSHSIHVRVD